MKTYNWGIIGAGWIAARFTEDLKKLPQARLRAIASMSSERARHFSDRYDVPAAYDSWEYMAEDEDIDIVYVATHHPFHHQNALKCLNRGKAVLCEKPFTMNHRELEELVVTARANRVFLMEAIWTRFLPSTMKVMEILNSGRLGKLQSIYADFGFKKEYDPGHRLFDPAKGGGALLDIGIYPLFLSLLTAGKPQKIHATARFSGTGVDHSCNMIFEQEEGVVSSLNCTLVSESPVEAHLLFDKGRIRMESWWLTPGPLTIYYGGYEPEFLEFPEPGHGYQYEALEVMRCLDAGWTESPLLPLDFSMDLMETLDQVRNICGIHYRQDHD